MNIKERIEKKKFHKGDKVKSTKVAKESGMFSEQRLGVVATNSRVWSMVSVRLRGQKTPSRYSIEFWSKDNRDF